MSDEISLAGANAALDLPPRQIKALEGLKLRMGYGKTAKYAGVDRKTLCRWMHYDAHFIAAYNDIKALTFLEVEATLVAGAPAAARRLAQSARTNDKAAAVLLKTVREIESKSHSPTDADEVAEERMLAEEKRRVNREMKKQKILEQNLDVLYETSRRKEAMEEAKFEHALRAQLERPEALDPKAAPPAPAETATQPLPKASTEPTPDAPAPPPPATPPEPEASQAPAAPEPPVADAGNDEEGDPEVAEFRGNRNGTGR